VKFFPAESPRSPLRSLRLTPPSFSDFSPQFLCAFCIKSLASPPNHIILKRHHPILPLKLRQRHHINRIPRTPLQKRPIRPLASTKFAPNAQKRIHQNPPKRRMLAIRHPEHAIRHRAILHASGRPRASRAHLVDHRHNVRLAFPLGSSPLGNRLILLNLAIHITRHCRGIFSHARSIEPPNSPTFSTPRAGKSTESRCSAIRPENRRCRVEGSAPPAPTRFVLAFLCFSAVKAAFFLRFLSTFPLCPLCELF